MPNYSDESDSGEDDVVEPDSDEDEVVETDSAEDEVENRSVSSDGSQVSYLKEFHRTGSESGSKRADAC